MYLNLFCQAVRAASQFQHVVEALINVAATENKLRRIGEEIKKTSRRVNALEQIVVPDITAQIKGISDVLDQRALEEVTTLKRIKAKIDAEDEDASGKKIASQMVGAGL